MCKFAVTMFYFALILCLRPDCLAQSASPVREQAEKAYREKNFLQSADLYLKALKEGDENPNTAYNAACALALAGRATEALGILGRLAETGVVSPAQLTSDPDFNSLRGSPEWKKIMDVATETAQRFKTFWDSPAFATAFHENPTDEEKLAGLSKIWSEAKYNFVYFARLPNLDWDALYLSYIPRVRSAQTTAEYFRVLTEFLANLKDGHTGVSVPAQLRDKMLARPLVSTRLIGGKVWITGVYDEALKKDRVLPYTEILEIDGEPVFEYVKRNVAPLQSASTPQDLETRTFDYGFCSTGIWRNRWI